MNVLIIGSGGREHALGWKIKQSKKCGKLYFAPGNGGTAELGTNVPINADKADTKTCDQIDYFCRQNNVELIIIGPEDPLAEGMADKLARPGRYVFGPTAAAARIEADKAYAKQLMRAAGIPTGDAKAFTDYETAVIYASAKDQPMVIKASGLAKGKGVTVCSGSAEALEALKLIMKDKVFGDAGSTVLIEEKLTGQEVSILALVDGRNIFVLDPVQDHKQAYEGDKGPNTGGMGTYCPTPIVSEAVMNDIHRLILVPMVDVLRRSEGVVYQGVMYAGLMLTAGGPKVIEFNARFGDPETQALMMRLKGDMLEVILAVCKGELDKVDLHWDTKHAACVVMASGGYPGEYRKGLPISGIADAEAIAPGLIKVFHAGTSKKDKELVTAGGRVLNVTALGNSLKEARDLANKACAQIHFQGAQYRKDIGFRVMK